MWSQPAMRGLGEAPEAIIALTQDEVYSIPLEEQRRIQLAGARRRFESLVETVPVLRRLAEEQGITAIRGLDDLAPLLLPHSALKAYPLSYLEQSRFDRLTHWLDGFTAHDLSGVDVEGCEAIDDWIERLDAQTPVQVIHSTGTSGKLSFLPRSTVEAKALATGYVRQFDTFGDELSLLGRPPAEAPLVFMSHRTGAMTQHRLFEALTTELFDGDEAMIVAANPTRFSADAASIGGRLRAAEARGEIGELRLSPTLKAGREAFIRAQAETPVHLDAFFAELDGRLRGQTVAIMGFIPLLYGMAMEAQKRGIEQVFAPDSFASSGGGMKGHALPDDWPLAIDRFLGGVPLREGYGMTELVAITRICPRGHFHLPAWQIPFVLDPVTGQPHPRTGTVTGRYGAFDLNAQTYWAGILTGDEVTLSWGDDAPCPCGRIGAYVHRGVRRYSEQEGGDDKITCAGAPQAHDKALEFILRSAG